MKARVLYKHLSEFNLIDRKPRAVLLEQGKTISYHDYLNLSKTARRKHIKYCNRHSLPIILNY